MKKYLLLASAGAVIFAASSASAMQKGLELGIEGYVANYLVYADQEDAGDDRNESEMKREYEIDFTGEVALDNGVTVGVTIELQQNVNSESTLPESSSEDVQESYAYVEGGFGKVILGQEYNVAYLMQVAAPSVDASFDGMDPIFNVITTGANDVTDQSYDMSAQELTNQPVGDKISYITPVWKGFQAGVSYTPNTDTVASRGEMSAENDEAFAASLRYAVEDLGGADWTFGGGYNKTADTTLADDNYEQWNVGILAEWDAIDFGVAYYGADADVSSVDQDEMAIAAGFNYETGNFTYGLSYLYKEVGDDDDLNRYMGGVNYSYGPGMSLNGSVSYSDYSADATAQENSATVVAIGTVINF